MQPYHWIPLLNALVYATGTLCLKRATTHGVGPWRTTFVSNSVLFLASLPLWFLGEPLESLSLLWMAFALGLAFFLGQVFTCLAIHKGDVSLLTPLMGTKTIFVAIIVSIGLGETLAPPIWIGAVLSAAAILLMSGGAKADKSRVGATLLFGTACSLSFAGADSMFQAFGDRLGFFKATAGCFSAVMLLSFLLTPAFRSLKPNDISKATWKWLLLGSVLMAIQAGLMCYVISSYGEATVVNIMYSSRGIWSVVLVWSIGHWFSNTERLMGRAVLLRRLVGSALLLAAILTVLD